MTTVLLSRPDSVFNIAEIDLLLANVFIQLKLGTPIFRNGGIGF